MAEETEIEITRTPQGTGGFPPVEVTQSQLVFWLNKDPQSPHWPFFPDQPGVGPRFQIGPGNTSDPVQPYAGNAIPQGQQQVINYSCRVSGHETEQGVITVWPDFLVQSCLVQYSNKLPDGVMGQPYAPVLLTQGGKPPYSHSLTDASLPQAMEIKDAENGVTVSGTPSSAGQDFAFTVHCKDALGNRVDQTVTLIIAPGAKAAG
jgi:hypothetical protein